MVKRRVARTRVKDSCPLRPQHSANLANLSFGQTIKRTRSGFKQSPRVVVQLSTVELTTEWGIEVGTGTDDPPTHPTLAVEPGAFRRIDSAQS
jgi:hypothetical protein